MIIIYSTTTGEIYSYIEDNMYGIVNHKVLMNNWEDASFIDTPTKIDRDTPWAINLETLQPERLPNQEIITTVVKR